MAGKNLHDKPFDQGTIAKLEIFEDYAEAWIPAFVMQGKSKICIFDFFAGTGYDINGIAGSPIRILDKIRHFLSHIFRKGVKVNVYLNEYEPDKRSQPKFALLQKACTVYLDQHKDLARAIELHLFNEDSEVLFPKLMSTIENYPSLVYLDQNGVKFLSNKYLLALEKMRETDFLYFVSSSYISRFGNTPEFRMHIEFDLEEAKQKGYRFIHCSIIEQLRRKLPSGTDLRLYPFSILKGSNVYGIVFGTTHPLAVDKFLSISWKRNELNGEADFDIHSDKKTPQMSFFNDGKLTKREQFKQNVRSKILSGEITDNFGLLEYAYNQSHIGSHAAEVLREMKKQKEVDFDGSSPLVTYENVFKIKKRTTYKVLRQ
jgi:three-Cys-motif partner protein